MTSRLNRALAAAGRVMVAALAVAGLLAAAPTDAAPARVLTVATAPVPPAKLRLLEALAPARGVEVRGAMAERTSPDEWAALVRWAHLIVLDAPREHMENAVRERLGPTLDAAPVPQVWMRSQGEPPARGLPAGLASRLQAYYVHGGRLNFERWLETLGLWHAGADWGTVAPPITYPAAGIYHPRAPQRVWADVADYWRWRGLDPRAPGRPPVIAIAFHPSALASEQTALIDYLVERIEAAGALALPYYNGVMGADAVRRVLAPGGERVADVIINTQITLDAEGRRTDFAALGVPVVQAMVYRQGDEAAWRVDPQGVRLMDVPFYLAQAEYAGVVDIQIAAASRRDDDTLVPIASQADAVVHRALRLVRLQRLPARDKRLTLWFWNYPPGERNLSASFMNLPRSLSATLSALQAAGYDTRAVAPEALTASLQRLLAPYYRATPSEREEALRALLREGLAERLPMADYRQWFDRLPPHTRTAVRDRYGEPERSAMVVRDGPQAHFVIPRLALGGLALLPQPPRGEPWEDRDKALYHSTSAAPSHHYLATYLWAREQWRSDAIVHFGTHGSQEWLPGKERGLAVSDFPMLAVGDVPVIYPYIVDNIGEALQAKRRGRAVILSHQTPPFAPAGLHSVLSTLHDQLHAWLAQDDGVVKEQLRRSLTQGVLRERLHLDMGWTAEHIERDFPAFVTALHDHLHALALEAQPLGLHTWGRAPADAHRLATVLMMLGQPFWEAAAAPGEQADETLVADHTRLAQTSPYRILHAHLVDGQDEPAWPEAVRRLLPAARLWWQRLGAQQELPALLAALEGRHIETSYGGDPIKNPDAYPTGRNLYGFDPSRVPTREAWTAGREAAEQLIATHRQQAGRPPRKLAFALWSVETMRHHGLLEAQALAALGVEPVWDAGGRVVDVRLIPREQLGRPRVDVVLSATGLYRDHFPHTLRLLAKAAQLAAQAEEPDNPVAGHTREIQSRLQARGLDAQAATLAAQTRIFSSETGRYGTGLDDATLATDTWRGRDEGDRQLAQLYLSRMQHAYGPDESQWGQPGARGINLYAEQLRGTEGAVLSRSSNLYGLLTTDDPFQYLGGIALAARHLDGQAPQLYISDLRGSGSGKVEAAARFLARELATRQFHPGHVQGLMAEGYAGTLQVLDAINNFWGWQATAREIVRDDQWQEFVEVYVHDKHRLGLAAWFERHNPSALAQSIERMLEAARQGYWRADAQTLASLRQRWSELGRRHGVRTDNLPFLDFVQGGAAPGYGLGEPRPAHHPAAGRAAPSTPRPPKRAAPAPGPHLPAPPAVRGLALERQVTPVPAQSASVTHTLATLLALALAAATGAGRQWRRGLARSAPPLSPSIPRLPS